VDDLVGTTLVALAVADVALMDATPDVVNDFVPDPNCRIHYGLVGNNEAGEQTSPKASQSGNSCQDHGLPIHGQLLCFVRSRRARSISRSAVLRFRVSRLSTCVLPLPRPSWTFAKLLVK
jgi:hypothetical protein